MAVTFIQSSSSTSTTATSVSRTLSGVAAGNLLVAVFVVSNITSIADVNVSDNNGNVWTIATSVFNNSQFGNHFAIAYATGVQAGNTTVTLTVASAVNMGLQIAEFNSGVAGRNLNVDQIASATGSGTSLSSGNATTTSNAEALVGLIVGASNPVSVGSGFTIFGGTNPLGEYQIASSTGTFAATGTTVSSGAWTAILVTFLVSPFPVFNTPVGRFDGLGQFVGNLLAPIWTASNVVPVTVAANSTSDQNLMAITVPANTLNKVGRTINFAIKGVYSTPISSVATLEIKVKLGSLTVLDIITTANAGSITNNSFLLEGQITTQTAGSSAALEASGILTIDLGATTATACSVFADTNAATVSTVDLTADEVLQVTVAFSAGSTSNSATQRQMVLQTSN